jgi:hypothetical protein
MDPVGIKGRPIGERFERLRDEFSGVEGREDGHQCHVQVNQSFQFHIISVWFLESSPRGIAAKVSGIRFPVRMIPH